MNAKALAVLVDGLFFHEAEELWQGIAPVVRWPEQVDEGAQELERLFEAGVEGFVLHGGDELVGQVLTAYWRRSDFGARPLQIWPLDVGEALLASEYGSATPSKAAAWLKGGGGRFIRRSVSSLKVTASTEEAAWYGFSFGTGWIYRAYEARKRARGGAQNFVAAWGRLASDAWRQEEPRPVALQVAVNHSPHKVSEGSLMVTTLKRSYFGIGAASGEPRLWSHLASSSLIGRALTPESLNWPVQAGQAFESLHLDGPQGWVLDGRLYEGGPTTVLQVMAGPTVGLSFGSIGLGAKISGLLGRDRR